MEIKSLVTSGYVQTNKKVARPCPPNIWANAMEQMIERRDRLAIPMPNHNYLRIIAYEMADQQDAKEERASNKRRMSRVVTSTNMPEKISNPLDQYIQGLRDDKPTDEEMEQWKAGRLK